MKPIDITLIDNIFNKSTADKLSQYMTDNCVSDTEPFSKLPYRGRITSDDITSIDPAFNDNIQTILTEHISGVYDIASMSVHFKSEWVGEQEHWHQDYPYNALTHNGDPSDFYRIFIAIDEHTKENGCLMSIPGQQNEGLMDHDSIVSAHGYQKYRIKPHILTDLYTTYGVQYHELRPGQGVLFNSTVPHASCSNQTPISRRALQIQLVKRGTPAHSNEFTDSVMQTRRAFELKHLKKLVSSKKSR